MTNKVSEKKEILALLLENRKEINILKRKVSRQRHHINVLFWVVALGFFYLIKNIIDDISYYFDVIYVSLLIISYIFINYRAAKDYFPEK